MCSRLLTLLPPFLSPSSTPSRSFFLPFSQTAIAEVGLTTMIYWERTMLDVELFASFASKFSMRPTALPVARCNVSFCFFCWHTKISLPPFSKGKIKGVKIRLIAEVAHHVSHLGDAHHQRQKISWLQLPFPIYADVRNYDDSYWLACRALFRTGPELEICGYG